MQAGAAGNISNVRDIAAAIKVYDGGVVSGELTLSDDRDWAGTIRDCEDTVSTPDFCELFRGGWSRHNDGHVRTGMGHRS